MNISVDKNTLAKVDQLLDAGLELEAIKSVRSCTGCGLKEAKDYIDNYSRKRMGLAEPPISHVEKFDADKESYTDFLKRHTKTKHEVEQERNDAAELSWKKQVDKQMPYICQEIMQRTFELAQSGHTQLRGVLRHPDSSATGWFVEFTSIDNLQTIKANTDNNYRTSFYTFQQSQYVKSKLQETLNAVGMRNKVNAESACYYIDHFRLKGGFFRSKEVKERTWAGDKQNYVIVFSIKW